MCEREKDGGGRKPRRGGGAEGEEKNMAQGEKGSEWERLIPALSPELQHSSSPESYARYNPTQEQESLIKHPTVDSSIIGPATNYSSFNAHSNIQSDATINPSYTYGSNPQINLECPSAENLPDVQFNLHHLSENVKQDLADVDYNAKEYERQSTYSKNSAPDSVENIIADSDLDDDKIEDTKSQSRLSASPDFWRRVSPQLVYIDSGSYGGSYRSGSVNSASSYLRGRSVERGIEDKISKYSRGRSVDSGKELDSRSVDSEPILDSERNVSFKLALDTNKEEVEWTRGRQQRKVPLRKQKTLVADIENNSFCFATEENVDDPPEIDNIIQTDTSKIEKIDLTSPISKRSDVSYGFLSNLKKTWIAAKGVSSIRYSKDCSNKNADSFDKAKQYDITQITIDNTKSNSRPSSTLIKNFDKSNDSSVRVESTQYSNPDEKAKLESVEVKETGKKALNKTSNKTNVTKPVPSNRKTNNITDHKNIESSNIAKEKNIPGHLRGQLRRYFSLDSSPATDPRLTHHVHQGHLKKQGLMQERRRLRCHHIHNTPGSPGIHYDCDHAPNEGESEQRRTQGVHQNQYYMEKDLRYYFQHPWFRLFVAYLVIFCNFLLFAEDPLSHSHTGNLQLCESAYYH